MRAKSVLVTAILLILGLAVSAFAQQVAIVTSTSAVNNAVVYKGEREVMGAVNFAHGQAGTIQVGVNINIAYSVQFTNRGTLAVVSNVALGTTARAITYNNGLVLTVGQPGGATGTGYLSAFAAVAVGTGNTIGITGIANNTTTHQAIVTIAIPAGTTVVPTDYIQVDGVRADVSGLPLNGQVTGVITSNPPNVFSYTSSNVVVATVYPNFTVENVKVGGGVICTTANVTSGEFDIVEGFAGAFVQYVTTDRGTAVPANARVPYGANRNTEFEIKAGPLPSGVTLTWGDSDIINGSRFELVDVSSDTTTARYEFQTDDQAISDNVQEAYHFFVYPNITPTSGVGTINFTVQMAPLTTETTAVPKFKSQITDAQALIKINRCVTYLLFPYVANGFGGYDTGFAVANTSFDKGAFDTHKGANIQTGPITFYYYPKFASGTAADPLQFTTDIIASGNTYVNTMSGFAATVPGFAASQGYIIAVAQFQNAHGYGFITYNMGQSVGIAQGYVANVIPDPTSPYYELLGSRGATTTWFGGETLGH